MSTNRLISIREQKALSALIAVGIAGFAGGLYFNSSRLWPSVLLNSFYFVSLALGGLVFVAIQYVSNAGWSVAIRRIPEAMMAYVPAGALTLLVVFFGRNSIYEWTHAAIVQPNTAWKLKSSFLSTGFFFGRMLAILAIWAWFAYLLRRESRLQDSGDTLDHTGKSKTYSSIFLVVFAITFSLASFDWLMSLEPQFYSTIYAFYCFSGLFLSGIAAVALLVVLLRKRGLLAQVSDDHLHNLGKLIFGFSTFWAYIWLSQYLLIYYANLPEETVFYMRQTSTPAWKTLFLSNLFLNWLVPFVLLLSRKAKRDENRLMAAAAIVLAGHGLDLYLMIFPALGASALLGFVDVALALGFTGLFLRVFVTSLEKLPVLPGRDPYLAESLSLHSYEPAGGGVGWGPRSNRALALSTIGFAVSFSLWGLLGALAPRFREMYGLSPLQTSLLIAVPVLLGSLGRIPMGILTDRFGGRVVFGVLLVWCFIAALGATATSSYRSLLGCGFLIGFAGASFAVGAAFTSKWFPRKQQGAALGIYGIGNIGQSVAVFGAPALVAATGSWRTPFWVFGAAAGLFGIAFFWLARNASAKAEPKKLGEYLIILKRQPIVWLLSLFYFVTFGGFVALSIYLPTLLKDMFSLAPTDAGSRVAGFVVLATGMRPVGGWLADRYGGANVLALALGLISVLAFGLTSSSMMVFTVGALGCAAALGLGNGAVFRLVPDYFPRETGTATGLVGAAGGLGGFFPPLVLGLIRTQTGSYALGFVFLSGFALICLAANYIVVLRHQGERRSLAGAIGP